MHALAVDNMFSSVQFSCSVMTDSLRPHGLQPTRLLCPWDPPGKGTGVGCRCLLRLIWLDLINFGEPCKTDVFVIKNCWVSNTKSTDCETFINWTSSNVSTLCCAVLSHIRLFATPWTVAYQTPLSMEFSRQECWSGVPFPSPKALGNHANLGEMIILLHRKQNF